MMGNESSCKLGWSEGVIRELNVSYYETIAMTTRRQNRTWGSPRIHLFMGVVSLSFRAPSLPPSPRIPRISRHLAYISLFAR